MGGRITRLLGCQLRPLRLQSGQGAGRSQEKADAGDRPGHGSHRQARLRLSRGRNGDAEHRPHAQRRGPRQPSRKALVQERHPLHPQERGLHGHPGLGHFGHEQGRAGSGGEGIPLHRLQVPVPQGEPEAALPRPQEGASPQGGKHLSPHWTGPLQGVQPGAVRPGRQEREVRLLRLSVPPQARQWHLRCSQAQRPALRGEGGGQDSGERADRVQHPGAGEDGGRGDGRDRQGAEAEAGDRRGGAGGREAQDGTALRPGGDHGSGHRRLQAPHQRPQGAAGEA